MTEAAQNPIDVDMFSALQTQSEIQTSAVMTSPAESFIDKCIHPPSAVPGFEGLPTNDSRSQVVMEWRNLNLQKLSLTWADKAGTVKAVPIDPPTDICILLPNGPMNLSYTFCLPPGSTTWVQDLGNTDIQELYGSDSWIKDVQLYRPIYKSTTVYLNATMFNNVGILTSEQFNPNILFSGTLYEFAMTQPNDFYDFIACEHRRTPLLQSSIVTDRRNEFDSLSHPFLTFPRYVRDEICLKLGFPSGSMLNLDPNTTAQVVNFGVTGTADANFPPSNSQILQQSVRSYAGKALDGAFVVQKLNSVSPPFMSGSRYSALKGLLYNCYYVYYGSDGAAHYFPFYPTQPLDAVFSTALPSTDALWSSNMTWSFIRFSGLQYSSEVSQNQTQLLVKKYYTGYEIQPSLQSALAGMVRLGPKPNIALMQSLMDRFYDLKDCMPAIYNIMGSKLIKPIAKVGHSVFKAATSGIKTTYAKKWTPKEKKKKEAPVTKTVAKTVQKEERQVKDLEKQIHSLNKKMDMMISSANKYVSTRPKPQPPPQRRRPPPPPYQGASRYQQQRPRYTRAPRYY